MMSHRMVNRYQTSEGAGYLHFMRSPLSFDNPEYGSRRSVRKYGTYLLVYTQEKEVTHGGRKSSPTLLRWGKITHRSAILGVLSEKVFRRFWILWVQFRAGRNSLLPVSWASWIDPMSSPHIYLKTFPSTTGSLKCAVPYCFQIIFYLSFPGHFVYILIFT